MSVALHTLPNGFRIVTEHMPGLQSAAVGVWVSAGGRHERAEQNGIAHFLEHMAFKGTKTRSARDIAEAIEDVGGDLNAYTSREATAYYARVLGADLPLAVDVIADILLNPALDPAEIELERGVILQEIAQMLDTPDDVIFERLQERAYPDQPMGRGILGSAERVRAFDRGDLSGFVAEHYGPERMILAAAGAVDHDRLVRQAEALFGHLKPGPRREHAPARYAGGESRAEKGLEQVHFALAFETPGYRDPDIYTAQGLAGVLGGGMSSRLFQEIRERRGLCYAIFAHADAYADTGLMTIYAGAGELSELPMIVADELRRCAGDVTGAEVARVRARMKAGLLIGLENPANRAERLARMILIRNRVPGIAEVVEKIDAVTVGAVRDFAGRMLAGATPTLALYGPVRGAPDLSQLRARLAG